MLLTADQAIRCVILCQLLTNTFIPIFLVRLDESTGHVLLLAGDNVDYRDGFWRFL
ncbi:MAG: hypothetical protein ACFB0E_00200 [Leptolyngbyaceae cyanobacterium]